MPSAASEASELKEVSIHSSPRYDGITTESQGAIMAPTPEGPFTDRDLVSVSASKKASFAPNIKKIYRYAAMKRDRSHRSASSVISIPRPLTGFSA
jgi:hypothetical protein